MLHDFRHRGFLPAEDPLTTFPAGSPYTVLDELGEELPVRLADSGFREWARGLDIPQWTPTHNPDAERIKHLYYVRTGFLASGYINQVGEPPVRTLPENLARPLCQIAADLNRPPVLSYAGYALYNWQRLDPAGPIALGNIDTVQNFVTLYDEHWFILVHVDIEARAGGILSAIFNLADQDGWRDQEAVDTAINRIADTVVEQVEVLKRIPEYMSPELYHGTFRPYIQHFDDVVYEGMDREPLSFRGEAGTQSSVVPLLVSFFKIPHEPNELTRHLADMRRYMPARHRQLLEHVDAFPGVRDVATPDVFDRALEAVAEFRSVHFGWARQYIEHRDPSGSGGTPYAKWLNQLRDETLAHRITGD